MGSSASGRAREAKWGVTAKGSRPAASRPPAKARSSALAESRSAAGSPPMDLMRPPAIAVFIPAIIIGKFP
jgi:hypothetical protein